MRARDYRAAARKQLGGQIFANNWLFALLILVIYGAILGAVSFTAIGSLILMGPLTAGVAFFMLKQARTGSAEIGDMFKGFSNDFGRLCVLGILHSLFIFLWSLLFVIPGIIKGFSYSQAFNLANDHPDWEWKQCIDESRKLMDGHKWELFCLMFSFIGWMIVGSLTFGIGMLWVAPYMEAANTQFYLNLVGEQSDAR